jgi:hypothetical protein
MIIKEMFYISIKLIPELAFASMTETHTSALHTKHVPRSTLLQAYATTTKMHSILIITFKYTKF